MATTTATTESGGQNTPSTPSTSTTSSSSASSANALALSNAHALQLALSHLQGALTYTESTNVETNKKLWNEYAKNYQQKKTTSNTNDKATDTTKPNEWVLEMASHVARTHEQLTFLGDEWSDEDSLDQSLNEFLFPVLHINRLSDLVWKESTDCPSNEIPYLPSASSFLSSSASFPSSSLTCAEIGVGGGRIASRVYPHIKHLYCFDISEEMLKQAQTSIKQLHAKQLNATNTNTSFAPAVSATSGELPSNLSFHLLTSSPNFPPKLHGTCDVVYSFDVLPHVDLHTIYGYFKSIRLLLKPNPVGDECALRPRPRVFLHTANLCAPLGFDRFKKQSKYTAGGFYFLSPEIIHQLAKETGYRIIQQSRYQSSIDSTSSSTSPDQFQLARAQRQKNLYYQRDFLFVMEVI